VQYGTDNEYNAGIFEQFFGVAQVSSEEYKLYIATE
jgi:hypothetical protein